MPTAANRNGDDDLMAELRKRCDCPVNHRAVESIGLLRKQLRERPGNAVKLLFAETATRRLADAVHALRPAVAAKDADALFRLAGEAVAVLDELSKQGA